MFGMEFTALAGPGTSSAEERFDPAVSKKHNPIVCTQNVLAFFRIAKPQIRYAAVRVRRAAHLKMLTPLPP
jgi:hypothetical protein